MPNRNGMTTQHGMSSVKGKPDVQGSSCMKDCVKERCKVTSTLPEFARNQHGNLAEQKRPIGPYRGIDTTKYDSAAVARRPRHRPSPPRRRGGGRCEAADRRERLHRLPRGRQQDRRAGLPRSRRQVPGPQRRRGLPGQEDQARAGRARGVRCRCRRRLRSRTPTRRAIANWILSGATLRPAIARSLTDAMSNR